MEKFANLIDGKLKNISRTHKKGLKQVIDDSVKYDPKTQKLTTQYFTEDDKYIYRMFHVEQKVIKEPPRDVMRDDLVREIQETFVLFARHLNSDTPKSQTLALKIRGFLKVMRTKIVKAFDEFSQADYQAMDIVVRQIARCAITLNSDFEMQDIDEECVDILDQDTNLSPQAYLEAVIDYGNKIMQQKELE